MNDAQPDSSVEARILCHTLGIFNMHRQMEMAQRIEWAAKLLGLNFEDTRIKMVNSWEAYKAARPRLQWAFASAVKFYESDIWMDEGLWPWDGPRAPSLPLQAQPEISVEEANEVRQRLGMRPIPTERAPE